MNYTTNYNLRLPEPTDNYTVEDANENARIVDEELKKRAALDETGKVPVEQIPELDYETSGSAAAVQKALEAHVGNKENPHGVTAEQVGAYDKSTIDQKLSNQTTIEVLITTKPNSQVTAYCSDLRVTAQAGEDGTVTMKLPSYGAWKFSGNGREKDLNVTITMQYSVDLRYAVYGIEWDGTKTTRWVRTDDSAKFSDPIPAVGNGDGSSPFDKLLPWSGMKRVTDSAAGELVEIPKFWYKWTKDGSKLKLQISDGPVDGFFVSPAHMVRGDGKGEREKVYVGRYHCATSDYKSQSGVQPYTTRSRASFRVDLKAKGNGIFQWDFAMHWTIAMLYLVEFADWDIQKVIGYGCSDSGEKSNNGNTDAMRYHTGTTAANRNNYGFCQYRHIEGLWDNVLDFIDGCYYNSSGLYIILNPSDFDDNHFGTPVGIPKFGYPTSMTIPTQKGFEWVAYPETTGGSETTYVPDYWEFGSSNECLYAGGGYSNQLSSGLFYIGSTSSTGTSYNIGSRLMKLP